ncbi:DUF5946 family protein [Nonomuraea soli]|uniref:Uncharacterized protein n=1 Tax=Nonomuraea soli TaxID=1032476 RepID=A0A7W0HSM7_9ACTN|nr:DUF5946 family protein [Nonomuraea soli]MBA2893831.1 hypothetical protein [Nonomuraea soli]
MTDSTCDCGAPAGELGTCEDYYHGILAEEQSDPEMYRWHAVVVTAYLLQHPARGHGKYLDGQFRLLQFYVDQGLDALTRLTARRVARNNHRARQAFEPDPLTAYAPLPQDGPPARFAASFSTLPVRDGSFVFDGPLPYGDRIKAIAEATIAGWRAV